MIQKLFLTTVVCTSFVVTAPAEGQTPPAPAPAPAPQLPVPEQPLPVPQQPAPQQPQRRNKGQLSEDQRNLMNELRAKYDANKDGKLDEAERKAMTAEDKERMAKAGFIARKRGERERGRDRDDN